MLSQGEEGQTKFSKIFKFLNVKKLLAKGCHCPMPPPPPPINATVYGKVIVSQYDLQTCKLPNLHYFAYN